TVHVGSACAFFEEATKEILIVAQLFCLLLCFFRYRESYLRVFFQSAQHPVQDAAAFLLHQLLSQIFHFAFGATELHLERYRLQTIPHRFVPGWSLREVIASEPHLALWFELV